MGHSVGVTVAEEVASRRMQSKTARASGSKNSTNDSFTDFDQGKLPPLDARARQNRDHEEVHHAPTSSLYASTRYSTAESFVKRASMRSELVLHPTGLSSPEWEAVPWRKNPWG